MAATKLVSEGQILWGTFISAESQPPLGCQGSPSIVFIIIILCYVYIFFSSRVLKQEKIGITNNIYLAISHAGKEFELPSFN